MRVDYYQPLLTSIFASTVEYICHPILAGLVDHQGVAIYLTLYMDLYATAYVTSHDALKECMLYLYLNNIS